MKILAIETTGHFASVALLEGSEKGYHLHEEKGHEKLSHLQRLIPMIDELLKKRQSLIGDVTHIAVSQGPGSFTGIRIGIATAKALAQALNIPVVSVPSLKALARGAGDFEGIICPVLDARRQQIYSGGYIKKGQSYISVIEDKARGLDEFMGLVKAYCEENKCEALFVGDDYEIKQSAISVAEEGLEMIIAGKTQSFDEIKPVYLRQAEAQRKLEERLKR